MNKIIKFKDIIDEIFREDHGLGFSHNSTSNYDDVQFVRDPLNDPLLTGKNENTSSTELDESYKFNDFNWLSSIDGFNTPSDVYYGKILLGVIVSEPGGYRIERILGPKGTIAVKKTKNNIFKNKEAAAKVLHLAWKKERTQT